MGSERIGPFGRKPDVIGTVWPEERVGERERDWRELYDQNWEWIYRLVRRLGWGDLDVEDAVQDVFLVLIDKLDEFEGRAELRTWIHRVCINVVYEHRRKSRRRRLLAAVSERLAFWRAGPPTPHQQVETHAEVARLNAALAALAAKKRDVFVLCAMEGLSRAEAAELLGIPEATVRTRLHYAREEVLEAMEAGDGDA